MQLKRLKWSLAHAYRNIPHYRRKFDAAGVKPKDLRSLEDLAKFPFTAKADRTGISADVRIVATGAIERSIGKVQRVTDKRPK